MEQRGKLLTCDRCNSTHFLREVTDPKTYGEGFAVYEEKPVGWVYIYPEITKTSRRKLICPECAKIYSEAMHNLGFTTSLVMPTTII